VLRQWIRPKSEFSNRILKFAIVLKTGNVSSALAPYFSFLDSGIASNKPCMFRVAQIALNSQRAGDAMNAPACRLDHHRYI
jgi:hypothetical protein